MKTELWMIGKTAFSYLQEGMAVYEKRLTHYLSFSTVVIPDVKNAGSMSQETLKLKEAETVMCKLKNEDFLVLLDEKGKLLTSVEFAGFMEQKMQLGSRRLIFLIGGAFGFSNELYQRADFQLSMSKLTFSHQMVRLFLLEQIYRAMTIIKREGYHNE